MLQDIHTPMITIGNKEVTIADMIWKKIHEFENGINEKVYYLGDRSGIIFNKEFDDMVNEAHKYYQKEPSMSDYIIIKQRELDELFEDVFAKTVEPEDRIPGRVPENPNNKKMIEKLITIKRYLGGLADQFSVKDQDNDINHKSEQFVIPIVVSPVIVPEIRADLFSFLKDFFSSKDQEYLLPLLDTGNSVDNPLLFNDNGNRLADVFKQLINNDLIIGIPKKDLEIWIASNFQYRYRDNTRAFKLKYLNDIISTNKNKCQKPILKVTLDKVTGKYKLLKA